MINIIFKQVDGQEMHVAAKPGDSVMQIAVAHGVPGVIGECGGSLACATCHCYVEAEWLAQLEAISQSEDDMLDCAMAERRPESRLTCQLSVTEAMDGLILHVPGENL